MHDAAKKKMHLPASLAAVRLLLLLVVACCGLETRLWSFAATPPTASGEIALATPSFIGENHDSAPYDASDSLVAAKTTAGASDDVVSLFHQGNLRGGQVSATRPLSTSPSSDLLHYRPQGQLYEFQVPRSTLNQWEQQQQILRFQDLHAPSGIITPEIRVLPPASGQLNQFLVKP